MSITRIFILLAALCHHGTAAVAQQLNGRARLANALELAVEPEAHAGKKIDLRCYLNQADVQTAACAIHNTKGHYITAAIIVTKELGAPDRRRALNSCTGLKYLKECIANISAVVQYDNSVITLTKPKIEWVWPLQ